MLYIYNPINGVKTTTTYELLAGMTGKKPGTLASLKSKHEKIGNINCYLIDEKFSKETLRKFREKEKLKDEIWKEVNFNKSYFVSNYGRVKVKYKNGKEKLLSLYKKHGKKLIVKINSKEYYIHQLVANAFLEYEVGKCAFHKDGNIYNNHANNIGFKTKEELGKLTGGKSGNIPVLKVDIETNEILDEYDSIREAGRENYISYESIRCCIRGKQKTAGGYKWKIDDEFLKGGIYK